MGVYIPNIEKPKNAFNCSTKINPEERRCIYTGKVFEETLSLLLDRPCDDCPLIEIDPYNWANDLVFVVAEIEKARERLYKVSKIECERKRNDSNT